ncbi:MULTISPECIES: hypothetical protein [Bacillus]|nr:hypothetical protein [Bacillus sp. AY18-3]
MAVIKYKGEFNYSNHFQIN